MELRIELVDVVEHVFVEALALLRHPTTEMTAARTQVMAAFETAGTPARLAAVARERRRRATIAGAGAAAVLVAGSVAVLYGRGGDAPPAAPALAERPGPTTIGGTPVTAPPLPSVTAPANSAEVAALESARRAAARPTLTVTSPAGSVIKVNGRMVARGGAPWIARDTLPPGTYRVEAVIESAPAECTTARDVRTVRLEAGGRPRLQLNPRGCGTLTLDARLQPGVVASYSLTAQPDRGGDPLTGALPLSAPLILPEGQWRIEIVARPACAPFSDTLRIRESAPQTLRPTLMCGND
jgi:hypothetical protein